MFNRLENIDKKLFKIMNNEYLNGKDYCIYYLEDLIDARSESISLRNN